MLVLLSKLFSVSCLSMGKLKRYLSCGSLQGTQTQQIVGGADLVGMQLHGVDAPKARASQSAPALHPAEELLDPFALALTDPVTGVPGSTRIQSRRAATFDLRHVRPNALAAQERDERLVVVPLVGTGTCQ